MNDTLTILTYMEWPAAVAVGFMAFAIGGSVVVSVVASASRRKAAIAAQRDIGVVTAKGQVSQMPVVHDNFN